jgi:hypothetical protein
VIHRVRAGAFAAALACAGCSGPRDEQGGFSENGWFDVGFGWIALGATAHLDVLDWETRGRGPSNVSNASSLDPKIARVVGVSGDTVAIEGLAVGQGWVSFDADHDGVRTSDRLLVTVAAADTVRFDMSTCAVLLAGRRNVLHRTWVASKQGTPLDGTGLGVLSVDPPEAGTVAGEGDSWVAVEVAADATALRIVDALDGRSTRSRWCLPTRWPAST